MGNFFFILGNPRSGTSLFRLMLNSHPTITVPPESGFLQWWHSKYHDWNKTDCENSERLKEYITDLFSSKKIESWNLNKETVTEKIRTEKPGSYAQLCHTIYTLYSKTNNSLIGDKNNYYIHHTTLLTALFPDAKFIHLVRDGRDVACSYKALNTLGSTSEYAPKVTSEISEIAEEWSANTARLDQFINDKHGLTIRYEDLITNPEETLKTVCSYLEVAYSADMLRYHENEFHDEPASTMDWKAKTREKIDASNLKKHTQILSISEIETFDKICKKELAHFGYA